MTELTPREREVLELVGKRGMSAKEAAQALELAPSYVHNLCNRINKKLGTHRIRHAAVKAGLCLVLLVLIPTVVLARDPGGRWAQSSPKVREWFRQQVVPDGNGALSRYPCCSEADGEQVEEDIRHGAYWIKGGHFPTWTRVPDSLVIRGPNLHGQPVVWWAGTKAPYMIRCFVPGAGS